jgi:hypothetical protein
MGDLSGYEWDRYVGQEFGYVSTCSGTFHLPAG